MGGRTVYVPNTDISAFSSAHLKGSRGASVCPLSSVCVCVCACVCVCVCVCVYEIRRVLYMYACAHTHMHTHTHTHVSTYTHIHHASVFMHAYVRVCKRVCKHRAYALA